MKITSIDFRVMFWKYLCIYLVFLLTHAYLHASSGFREWWKQFPMFTHWCLGGSKARGISSDSILSYLWEKQVFFLRNQVIVLLRKQEIAEDCGFWLLIQSKILLVFIYTAYNILISSRGLASFALYTVQFCKIPFPFSLWVNRQGECISCQPSER